MELHVHHCLKGLVFAGPEMTAACLKRFGPCDYEGIVSARALWPVSDLIHDEVTEHGCALLTLETARRLLFGIRGAPDQQNAAALAVLFVAV